MFRFDLRYRALTGYGRKELEKAVEDEFPPGGLCAPRRGGTDCDHRKLRRPMPADVFATAAAVAQ
ncbi:hypothetical protein [Arthrobacter sp. BPSS-3]|uniref:hypothetical protein n=1 Tax=Arthrobacter sp. BPSS-3 TaxID=3366580 RepID=UPI0037DD803C